MKMVGSQKREAGCKKSIRILAKNLLDLDIYPKDCEYIK